MYKPGRIINTLVLFLIVSGLASCTIWNQKKWDSLQDRTFHFTQFIFICSGWNEKKALVLMGDFPTDEVFRVLSEHYRIDINADDFREFIKSGDETVIDAYGLLRDKKFVWKGSGRYDNTVELEYAVQYAAESTDIERSYRIVLKSGGKPRAIISGNVEDRDAVP